MSSDHFGQFPNVTKKDSFILSTFRDLNILSLFKNICVSQVKEFNFNFFADKSLLKKIHLPDSKDFHGKRRLALLSI